MKKKKSTRQNPTEGKQNKTANAVASHLLGDKEYKKKYKETNKVYKVYKLGISMREVLVKKGVQP